MNAFTQFNHSNISCEEVHLPCFPYLTKIENLEIKGTEVSFTLIDKTRSFIDVVIVAKEIKISVDRGAYDEDRECLSVTDIIGTITQVDDVYALVGWPVRLTSNQQDDLNQYLIEHFTELAKQKEAA